MDDLPARAPPLTSLTRYALRRALGVLVAHQRRPAVASTAYDRVRVGGVVLDKMTAQAFAKADDKLFRDTGKRMILVQGSYNAGGVSASAGTHDGGGTLDTSVRNLTASQQVHAVKCLRYYGFAAWKRFAPPFSGPHIHAVLMGNGRMSGGAAAQIRAYLNGRDGLAGNRHDGTWRPKRIVPYRYVEPAKPSPSKQVDRRIDQVWHVKPGKYLTFRDAPGGKQVGRAHLGGTNFRFERYAMKGGRKWLLLDDSKPEKWANSNLMKKGRS